MDHYQIVEIVFDELIFMRQFRLGLIQVQFCNFVLRNVILRNTVLRNAVLRNVILRNAVLRSAVLRNAVLRNAVLRNDDNTYWVMTS